MVVSTEVSSKVTYVLLCFGDRELLILGTLGEPVILTIFSAFTGHRVTDNCHRDMGSETAEFHM